jgi:hypothetical protein
MQDESMLLIDTRKTPWSRIPQWRQVALREKYGKRYRWAGEYLGNKNHATGGPIEIVNLPIGIGGLCMYLSEGHSLAIICQCVDFERCHNKVICDELQKAMPEVEIVQPDTMMPEDSMMCLSVRPPYASWLVNPQAFLTARVKPKTIENRDWRTSYRGPLLIHSSKKFESDAFDYWSEQTDRLKDAVSLDKKDYPLGAIVGVADLVNIVDESDDPWFEGTYGWILENARAFDEPIPWIGALKLFPVPVCHACRLPVREDESVIVGESTQYRLCAECCK